MRAPRIYPEKNVVSEVRPRLLLIAYHFPPSQATGSFRWEHIASFAVERGWGVDVLTLAPSNLRRCNWDRLYGLPEDVRVFAVGQPESWVDHADDIVWRGWNRIRYGLSCWDDRSKDGQSSRKSVRRQVYPTDGFPGILDDPRSILRAFWAWRHYAVPKAWAERAAEASRELIDSRTHRVIVTSGPPHMGHWAGLLIGQGFGLPLVLDFRDAWRVTEVVPEELASPVWSWLAKYYERQCVKGSSLIVANTEPLRDRMREEYADIGVPVMAVPNGFDESDVGRYVDQERFVIAYAGGIYLDRDPRPLMRATARVVREFDLSANQLSLEFMGSVSDFGGVPLEELAEEAGVGGHIRLHPPGTREEAMDFLSKAAVLVSLPQDLEMAIPSKIFDYMQFRAWVVAQARPGSASEMLLRDTGAIVVSPTDLESLAGELADCYRKFREDHRPVPLAADNPQLSRRVQARRLLDELDRWKS